MVGEHKSTDEAKITLQQPPTNITWQKLTPTQDNTIFWPTDSAIKFVT